MRLRPRDPRTRMAVGQDCGAWAGARLLGAARCPPPWPQNVVLLTPISIDARLENSAPILLALPVAGAAQDAWVWCVLAPSAVSPFLGFLRRCLLARCWPVGRPGDCGGGGEAASPSGGSTLTKPAEHRAVPRGVPYLSPKRTQLRERGSGRQLYAMHPRVRRQASQQPPSPRVVVEPTEEPFR